MTVRVKLTRDRVRQIKPPATGETNVWDTEVPGLGVRCLPSGVKSYVVIYRAGYGRAGTARRVTLGKVGAITLEDAREAAMHIRGQVMKGGDPVAERRALRLQSRREVVRLSMALDRYEADQARRNVSDRKNVLSVLRRNLLGYTTDIPVAELDRRRVLEPIEALEAKGQPGAAKSLRGHASTFLRWCADRALIPTNPLQGHRAQRATRAQQIARPGRTLSDAEIALLWPACDDEKVNPVFGAFVRFLLLTGQRRSETAAMRWDQIDDKGSWWNIPAEQTKNGNPHEVPLPPVAQEVLATLPRFRGCPFVFTTNGEAPISGWSKMLPKLREAAGLEVRWTLHDLRRTFRSGLTALGIEESVAEIMINHRPETLQSVYDREPRFEARRAAAGRWATRLAGIISPDRPSNVISMSEMA